MMYSAYKLSKQDDNIQPLCTPSYHLAGASPLPLDVGYLFLVGPNILLSMVVQQQFVILEFSQEKMSACPSTPPSVTISVLSMVSLNGESEKEVRKSLVEMNL